MHRIHSRHYNQYVVQWSLKWLISIQFFFHSRYIPFDLLVYPENHWYMLCTDQHRHTHMLLLHLVFSFLFPFFSSFDGKYDKIDPQSYIWWLLLSTQRDDNFCPMMIECQLSSKIVRCFWGQFSLVFCSFISFETMRREFKVRYQLSIQNDFCLWLTIFLSGMAIQPNLEWYRLIGFWCFVIIFFGF